MTTDKDMPMSIVDAQVERLLEIVNDYQQKQCSVLLEEAQKQAQQIMRQVYRDSRQRLHHDIQDTRQNMQQELAATRAKLHTLMMQQRHRADQEFLSQSWQLLEKKLLQRWQERQHRNLWIQKIVDVATEMLPGDEWQIAHPVDWADAEKTAIAEQVNNGSQRQLTFNADANIEAGISICADGALVDGTLRGLLADRVRIESEVLARCRECIVHRHDNP